MIYTLFLVFPINVFYLDGFPNSHSPHPHQNNPAQPLTPDVVYPYLNLY